MEKTVILAEKNEIIVKAREGRKPVLLRKKVS